MKLAHLILERKGKNKGADILITYVLLRLRVQNRRKKWNFPPNFRNGII